MISEIILVLSLMASPPAKAGTVDAQKRELTPAAQAPGRGVRDCDDATEQAMQARKAWEEACLPRRDDPACTEWPGAEGSVSRRLSDANGDCLVCRDESAAYHCLRITHAPY